jgi:hypothetical protein
LVNRHSLRCPSCGKAGHLHYHARYLKYHYEDLLPIFRLICAVCGVTHAVIPSFSLPDTSLGTREVEDYLSARQAGQTRGQAGIFFLSLGRSMGFLKHLEKSFRRRVRNFLTIFPAPEKSTPLANPLDHLKKTVSCAADILLQANLFCLSQGVNCVFFSRFSLLIFRPKNAPPGSPLNMHSPAPADFDLGFP